ncbi:MAG: TonB-dependent receptor [Steroidobacteraceae bacterium]
MNHVVNNPGVRAAVLLTLGLSMQSVSAVELEEIVVVSQKRAEGLSVQDIAAAVSAVDAATLDAIQAVDLSDVGRLVPNAVLHPSATFTATPNFFIRGIGVSGTTRSLDPAVGVIIDGIYVGFPVGANLSTFDRESIEIFRGPQGTLLGRNVTGGAVNIRTRRPDGQFRVNGELTIGDYSRFDAAFSLEGSLVEDKLAGKVAIISEQRNGYWLDKNGGTIDDAVLAAFNGSAAPGAYRNLPYDPIGTGDKGTKPDIDQVIVRPMLHFTPNESIEVTLIGEMLRNKSGTANSRNIPAPGGLNPTVRGYTPPENPFEINHDLKGYADLEVDSLTIEANYEAGNGVWTAIAGWRDLSFDSSTDFDGSPFALFHFPDNKETQEQVNYEIRYANQPSDKISYVVGVNYFDQEFFVGERRITGLLDRAQVALLNHENVSLFGEVDYFFNDQTKLTVGARWTDEKKDATFSIIGTCALDFSSCTDSPGQDNANLFAKLSDSDVTPKVALTYEWNDDISTYLSYTRGFRSGALDARAQTVDSFLNSAAAPETVDSYELGLKSLLLDRRLRFNAALFSMKYEDMQRLALEACQTGTPGCDTGRVQRLINAAASTINGIELEMSFAVTDNLVIDASYGYLDAGFDQFLGFDANGGGYDPNTDPAAARKLKFERVPDYNYALAATWSLPLESGSSINFRASYNYRDDQYNDAVNTEIIKQEGYGLLDASVGYESANGRTRVTLFGKNLQGTDYFDFALFNALTTQTWGGSPRTWGLRISYSME